MYMSNLNYILNDLSISSHSLVVFNVVTIFSVGCELYLGDVTWLVKTSTNEAFTANPHHQRKDFLRNSESHVGHDGKRQIGNI